MISAITPLSREWLYALVIQPYKEGAERINRAFSGVDFLSLEMRSLSLKEKMISLVSGILLLIPIINTIIWIAMQAFGHPEILTDPYSQPVDIESARPRNLLRPLVFPPIAGMAQIAAPPIQESQPPIPATQPVPPIPADPGLLQTSYTVFSESKGDYYEECTWKIEKFPDLTLVTKESPTELVASRYNSKEEIQQYHFRFQDGSGEMHVQLNDQILQVKGIKNGKLHVKTHRINPKLPWIQQMTLGFKPFILSVNKRFEFQIINPLDLSLHTLVAEKKGHQAVPGHGSLLEVHVSPTNWFYQLLGLGGTLWFHREGQMKKMIAYTDPREPKTFTEWLRNDP